LHAYQDQELRHRHKERITAFAMAFHPRLGGPLVRWNRTGPAEPAGGRLIRNARLAHALSNGKMEFTTKEWAWIGIGDLHPHDYVWWGDSYFQPGEHQTARWAHLLESELLQQISTLLLEAECRDVEREREDRIREAQESHSHAPVHYMEEDLVHVHGYAGTFENGLNVDHGMMMMEGGISDDD
jgi:hypothetical protein